MRSPAHTLCSLTTSQELLSSRTRFVKPIEHYGILNHFGGNIVVSEGAEWKRWRAIFNPVFSNANLTASLEGALEEVEVFKVWLTSSAKSGEVVKLFRGVTRLTMALAGRMVL